MKEETDKLVFELIETIRQTMPYISSRRAQKRLQHIATMVSKKLRQNDNGDD
jgi:hypothetical protein